MDPEQRAYWKERTRRNVAHETFRRNWLDLLQAQDSTCGLCGIAFSAIQSMTATEGPGTVVEDTRRKPDACSPMVLSRAPSTT
jgi:hypothetical protein